MVWDSRSIRGQIDRGEHKRGGGRGVPPLPERFGEGLRPHSPPPRKRKKEEKRDKLIKKSFKSKE